MMVSWRRSLAPTLDGATDEAEGWVDGRGRVDAFPFLELTACPHRLQNELSGGFE
jgi:hypothetical protein